MFRKKISTKKNTPFSIKEGGFKFGEIDGFSYRLAWAEDSIAFDGEKREIVGRSFEFKKIKIIFLFFFLFFLVLILRATYLQIIKGDYYNLIAEENRLRVERIEPKRGVIYDRNFNSLVKNKANFLLYFVPVDLPGEKESLEKLILEVSNILGNVSSEKIKEILATVEPRSLEAYQPLFIADKIEYEKALKIYLEEASTPGVVLTNKNMREYNLYSMSLSHILGYTGKISPKELEESGDDYSLIDYIGKTGVEYFWENELKGSNGRKQIEVDALGKEKKIVRIEEATDGHNLVLSLDINLQRKIEEILIKHLKKKRLNKASVVVLNPNNGEVLSLVSFPAFNNNVFARGISQNEYDKLIKHPDKPLFNRAISGEYPSGSTFKPVMSALALEEKVINERTSFLSVGGVSVGEWFFPDWKDGGHGITNVRKAIAESVNTFYYYIGGGHDDFEGLGVDRIADGAKLFGLGTQTGIDLAGESNGFLPSREWKERVKGERWYIGDTYHLAIGQGDILVTPLQVANFTCVFANGGKLYRPQIVKDILNSENKLIRNVEAVPVRSDFIDDYNITVVRQGMRQTITNGSARSLQSVPVTVAGKTGTAQWSSKKETHAWFTGFAPYKNPELVITVLIEEGGEGSEIAVPITREILTWYFGEYKDS